MSQDLTRTPNTEKKSGAKKAPPWSRFMLGTNMKNDDITPLATHFDYLGKSNNADKTDEDPTWWP